ncbi:hypothetical protein CEXT_802991 [Caerostris extrusa]|uniref:Uncharacterized protein n=1 Tax=Caerostris extrusa TaxID=172846 RepID=A0AAV4MBA3_CAEEX|nr:hypothetical protein CEXT_802991 [Caerostris extrusa]
MAMLPAKAPPSLTPQAASSDMRWDVRPPLLFMEAVLHSKAPPPLTPSAASSDMRGCPTTLIIHGGGVLDVSEGAHAGNDFEFNAAL